MEGVISVSPVRKLSQEEFDSASHKHIDLTFEHLEWDPTSDLFWCTEEAMVNFRGELVETDREQSLVISAVTLTHDVADITDDDNFAAAFESHVGISALSLNPKTRSGMNSSRDKPVDHLTLAKRWGVPANHAKSTV